MYIYASNPVNFCANFNSPKLKFKREDFFVRIRGYGQNTGWADDVIKTTDTVVNLIRRQTSPENILRYIAAKAKDAAKYTMDLRKRQMTGILRAPRDNWRFSPDGANLQWYTPYWTSRYSSYADRFDEISTSPLKNPYPEFLKLTVPEKEGKLLIHGRKDGINKSLDYIFELYKTIFPKFTENDISTKDLQFVNETIAEIRWILAHSTPFKRGSDAISNILMRAIYKAVGIKTYPIKKGISLDLEAYCTELKDYKARFTDYFEKKPKIIE